MDHRTRQLLIVAIGSLALLAPTGVIAHGDRDFVFPPGNGTVPTYRAYDGTATNLVVCKPDSSTRIATMAPGARKTWNEDLLADCSFEHIQAAIDAVTEAGSNVYVLPGIYFEEPSRVVEPACVEPAEGEFGMSYDWQYQCPHNRNLISILGDRPNQENRSAPGDLDDDIVCTDEPRCRLQVEGTGAQPEDVVIDGLHIDPETGAKWFEFQNGIRADRADGVYIRNLTVQHVWFSGIFVAETDGYVLDDVVGRWVDEYGLNVFVSDHGLIKDCEAYGGGDSGVYVGANPDHHHTRYAVEITGCDVHNNALGYSGTSGNASYVHHNRWYNNGTGIATDSVYPNHPGYPQDSAMFTDNLIYSNNVDYYRYKDDGTCDKPSAQRGYDEGVVCPIVPVPVGTGMLIAGGNANILERNQVWDNWRYGFMLFFAPAVLRGDNTPANQYDTSHFNRYSFNRMGYAPDGTVARNGTDFWWDEEGAGNCWSGNTGPNGETVTSDPMILPECGGTPLFSPGNPAKHAYLLACAEYLEPPCDWYQQPPKP